MFTTKSEELNMTFLVIDYSSIIRSLDTAFLSKFSFFYQISILKSKKIAIKIIIKKFQNYGTT